MAEKTYKLSNPAANIDKILQGAVVANFAQNLTENEKIQARENIGAGPNGLTFYISGYFDSLEDLKAAVTDPAAGPWYGVGTEAPYDFYSWDEINKVWVNNEHIKGLDGAPGKSGASVDVSPTEPENPQAGDMWYDQNNDALKIFNGAEWVLANDFSIPPASVGLAELKSEVTAEALGGVTITKLWENASPTSAFAKQTVSIDLSSYEYVWVIFGRLNRPLPSTISKIGASAESHWIDITTSSPFIYAARRYYQSSGKGVWFDDCLYSSAAAAYNINNEICVPLAIYGIKGGH